MRTEEFLLLEDGELIVLKSAGIYNKRTNTWTRFENDKLAILLKAQVPKKADFHTPTIDATLNPCLILIDDQAIILELSPKYVEVVK